jgi:hypothetical protein
LQRFQNKFSDALAILQHVVVPEAQDAPTFLRQERIAAFVLARLCMLSAIRFNDKTCFRTGEIDDKRRDDELPSESQAELFAAKYLPKRPLGISHVATKFFRALANLLAATHVSFRISGHKSDPT